MQMEDIIELIQMVAVFLAAMIVCILIDRFIRKRRKK